MKEIMEGIGAYAEKEGITKQQLEDYMNPDEAAAEQFCEHEEEICQKLSGWVAMKAIEKKSGHSDQAHALAQS